MCCNIIYRIVIIYATCFNICNLMNAVHCASDKFGLPDRLNYSFPESPFADIQRQYSPLSLEIGSPNLVPPKFLRHTLMQAAASWEPSYHQYAKPVGIDMLTREIAALYSILINRKIDPLENVQVTVGATEALSLTVQSYTLPGDEWIVIEPLLDFYAVLIKLAQGTVKYVQIKPDNTLGGMSSSNWTFDKDEMTNAFNEKTKGIILNTPHNPTGKIFTKEELRFIANLAIKWDVLIVVDEVYEWYLYDSTPMIRMGSLSDEIFERLIMVNSISKSYIATGWRVGWAIGPVDLIRNLKKMQPCVIFSHTVPVQVAAAEGLKRRRIELTQPNSFTSNLAKLAERKRNAIVDTLLRIGATPVIPEGAIYVFANYTALESKATGLELETDELRDHRFNKWLAKNVGLLVAAGSGYYMENPKLGEDYIRLNFLMTDETIGKVRQLLLDWFLQ